ncbi:DNA-protecting protein DprA [Rathayibacter rathayi]|uniref:DNA-processing protein DprA n=1 Tax=Rathayibacter rathayi TaxID=33887 RepID=UPI000CE8C41E|nr:DNA-processing protein DprA [Rathayibacter rathayi]PPG77453.1 DNA-protecting protein DprA [Rathayibacter rathayi]PPI65221.1 DNA-protecting protein DprA [Rathayibacter rathayi]
MTTQTAAGPLFGIEIGKYANLVEQVSNKISAHPQTETEISERFARAAWSHLAEPADSTAGTVVQALGATAALVAVAGRWDAPQLLEALEARIGSYGSPTLDELSTGLQRWTPRFSPETFLQALTTAAQLQVQLLTPTDPQWPAGLADLGADAPLALWARGDLFILETLDKSLSVCGARAASGYGEHATMEAVSGLVQLGYTIASGAAYGIDGMAHRAALASGGNTIAVLAGGVDRPYPAGHDSLIERIAVSGLVLSEVPPHTPPTKWRFLARSRILAALTRATIVMEAGHRSGSLSTAGHALALGRPVGALPGPITSAASAGCHRLIREHSATLVTSADEMAALTPEG